MSSACNFSINPQWKMCNDLWQNELPPASEGYAQLPPHVFNPPCHRGPLIMAPTHQSSLAGGIHPSWVLGSEMKGSDLNPCKSLCDEDTFMSCLGDKQSGMCATTSAWDLAHRRSGPGVCHSRPNYAAQPNGMREGCDAAYNRNTAQRPLLAEVVRSGNARGPLGHQIIDIPLTGSVRGYPTSRNNFAVKPQFNK